jgi:glycosyltransferase involved in cell wall biosynthesis
VETVVHPQNHEVIGLGVNPEKVAPPDFDRQAFRTAQHIEPDETLVLAVGRLVKRKGFPVLIDAIAQLVKQGKKIKFFLAGKGPEEAAIHSQIAALGMDQSITLLGFVPDSELRLYLKASDMLVMPSIADESGDTEGLGIPLLEAMANETPVIGSAIGGILDIVDDEKTGLLCPPQDTEALATAINRLIEDSSLRNRIVRAGSELVHSQFSWQNIARQTLDIFSFAVYKKSHAAAY